MKMFLLFSYLIVLVYSQIPDNYFQKCQPGAYDARIRVRQSMSYTKIPKGVIGLRVLLSAIPYDVDITLMNERASEWWVYPCSSRKCRSYISSPHSVTANVNGHTISYSGYKGLELTKPGVEWLEITGELNEAVYLGFKINVRKLIWPIPLAMRIEWEGTQGCTPEPQEGLDLKVLTNTRNHMTYRYREVPQGTLITRRGLEFIGVVTMNGAKPSNTFILFPDLDDVPGAIKVTSVKQINTNQLSFTVKINSSCPIGTYKLHVESNGKVTEANLVILFNPYLPETAEYMPDPVLLEETVENEEGIIWQGSNYQLFPAIFKFEQFDFVVLDMSLNLLRRMPIADRSNIVLVSRHLSFAINSDVCYGKWGVDPPPFEEGQPEDGYLCSPKQVCKTPTSWKSMAELARVHLSVGRNRVQYCQCFVYAAVTTAIGRTLGIATRPITNFQSAHDKNGNRAVDRFYQNVSGRLYEIDGPIEESVWNFHVWNEMWMKRSDITEEICHDMDMNKNCGDGWQAVDATPQELSEGGSGVQNGEGFYMCGPTAKSMVKANKIHTCAIPELNRESHPRVGCFDNNFLIAEVNANINIWIVNDNDYIQKCYQDGEKCGFPTDPFSVASTAGQIISTKAPGPISDDCRQGWCNSERLDITLTYKNPEPSWSTTARGRVMWAMAGNNANEVVVGTIPKGSTHVINELGSIYSATGVVASVKGQVGSKLMCTATISALDYRGIYISKKLNESLIQVMESDSILTSEKGECRFVITREMYGPFTSSVMSNVAKAVSAKVSLSIRVMAPNGPASDYLEERILHFCTPKNPMDVKSGEAECAANGGYFEGPERPECPDNNLKIGDGICNDELNNPENCYDNGDCCDVSCAGRYAGVENNDECPTDGKKCLDPDFQPGFILPKAEDPEKLETDNVQCSKINSAVKAVITQSCPTNQCTPSCQAALVDLICDKNKWEHWKCDTSIKSLTAHGCVWPRCPQKITPIGQGFNVWGDGHPPVKAPPMELLSKSAFKKLKDAKNNKQNLENPISVIPIVVCALVGALVGLLIGLVVGKRREVAL